MQLRIRRRDRAATVARYRHLEEMLWRVLELLPSQRICLVYKTCMWSDGVISILSAIVGYVFGREATRSR